jgi:nicotinate-nucleotide adenylyltransferase
VKVAVFGGSFNPPHIAHVMAVTVVLACHDVDRVLVVPAFRHPFGKPLAPFDDRLRMCELAMGWLPRVDVSRIEEELGEVKTLHMLERLHAEHPDWALRLVMGADLVAESSKWFQFDRVRSIAPPLVLGRAGAPVVGAPPPILPAVSSTEVRAKIASGAWGELQALVPRTVLAHVRERRLYGAA